MANYPKEEVVKEEVVKKPVHQFPIHMFRMKDGEVGTRLFREGPIPEGWYEDKFQAGYKKPKPE